MIRIKDLLLEGQFEPTAEMIAQKKENLIKLIKTAPNSDEILSAYHDAFGADRPRKGTAEVARIQVFLDEVEASGMDKRIHDQFSGLNAALDHQAGIMRHAQLPIAVRKKMNLKLKERMTMLSIMDDLYTEMG